MRKFIILLILLCLIGCTKQTENVHYTVFIEFQHKIDTLENVIEIKNNSYNSLFTNKQLNMLTFYFKDNIKEYPLYQILSIRTIKITERIKK